VEPLMGLHMLVNCTEPSPSVRLPWHNILGVLPLKALKFIWVKSALLCYHKMLVKLTARQFLSAIFCLCAWRLDSNP
jgi:hypothetical protein